MSAPSRRQAWLLGIFSLCGALSLGVAMPARCAEPRRPSLQGTWKFNSDLTARLSKAQEEQREERDGGGAGDRHGPGGPGLPGGAMSGGAMNGDMATDPARWSPAKERDARRRRELVADLDTLTISQQAGQVTLVDATGHARVLRMDGSKVRDQGALGPAQLRATWDKDGSLVVDVKPDKGTRHTESYLVSNDGKHLYLTVTISGQLGQLLRAYDAAPRGPAPDAQPTPAKPRD
jgi:hypothetical protein